MKSVTDRRILVEAGSEDLSIVKQCELLEISRSGFYYPIDESEENLAIMRQMDEEYDNTPHFSDR